MPTDGAVNVYKIQKAIQGLYGMTGTSYAKGYSGQRMVETLKELVALLDTRISIELVANGDWNPEENPVRPIVTEDGIKEPSSGDNEQNTNKPSNKPGNAKDPAGDKASNEAFFKDLWIVLGVALVVMAVTTVAIFQMARRKKNDDDQQTEA